MTLDVVDWVEEIKLNQNNTQIFDQLNSDCHRYVTDICHRCDIKFTPRQLKFIEVAHDKHQLTGEYFSRFDFPYLTRNNFSQMIVRINKKLPLIKKEISGKAPFYSLIGMYFDQNVTKEHTTVNTSFINQKIDSLYALAKKQPPFMHDIKLSSRTSQLYDNLLQTGLTPNPYNKQFIIPILANPRFDSKAQISSNGRMDLHIGCSQLPIPCTVDGFAELIEYLGEVKHFLSNRANSNFISEPAHAWIFEYYHFNRDSEPIIDSSYKFSLGQHNQYFYIKQFDNGEIKGRYEEKRTPKTTILQEQENILKPVYEKASELQKDEEKIIK